MAEGKIKSTVVLKPMVAGDNQEKITPPKEYQSLNGKIQIIIDGDDVTINFDGRIAEDIGCYRNIKTLRVKFKEGKGVSVTPMV